MITKDKHTFADGSVKTQVRVRQTYRPYPGAGAKRRTIKDFGYLEDQEDPEAFWASVNACNNSLQKERTEQTASPRTMASGSAMLSASSSVPRRFSVIRSQMMHSGIWYRTE